MAFCVVDVACRSEFPPHACRIRRSPFGCNCATRGLGRELLRLRTQCSRRFFQTKSCNRRKCHARLPASPISTMDQTYFSISYAHSSSKLHFANLCSPQHGHSITSVASSQATVRQPYTWPQISGAHLNPESVVDEI